MNETRKGAKLVPITPTRLGLVASVEKLLVQVEDMDKESKKRDRELMDQLKALELRISVVESRTGTTAEPAAAPDKRRKNSKESAKGRHGGQTGGAQAAKEANPVHSGTGKRKGKKRRHGNPHSSNVPDEQQQARKIYSHQKCV